MQKQTPAAKIRGRLSSQSTIELGTPYMEQKTTTCLLLADYGMCFYVM
jgi:hypothetical protein